MSHLGNGQQSAITEINVIPLVDIVLVVLIIFMVTANLMANPAIDMELPKAATGESRERNQFSLLLGKDGSVAIGDKRIEESAISRELGVRFQEYKEQKRQRALSSGHRMSDNQLTLLAQKELTMIIQADTDVSHGRVIRFIDEARRVGILKYAFNVDPVALIERR